MRGEEPPTVEAEPFADLMDGVEDQVLDRIEAWEQTGLHDVNEQQARALLEDWLTEHTAGGRSAGS